MNSRPYSADELRCEVKSCIAKRLLSLVQDRMCSKRQASLVAWYMGELFSMRFVRISCLEWLLSRPIASSNDLTFAEAHALLEWLSSNPSNVRQEAASVLVATFMTREAVR